MRILLLVPLLALPVSAQRVDYSGAWATTRGMITIEVIGKNVTATGGAEFTLTGTMADRGIRFSGTQDKNSFEGTLGFDASGHRFEGEWVAQGRREAWKGWRHDPATEKGKPISAAGFWRTSLGLLELEQTGAEVVGGFGAQGWSTVRGKIRGRYVDLTFETPFGRGTWKLDVETDRQSFLGLSENARGARPLIGQRVVGATRGVRPKPGEIVGGLGKNRLTYALRVPKGWRPGAKTPLVVVLHGSNMGARPYVESLAASSLAERFCVLGIDGEHWQDWSAADDPRHNYSYVDFMGRSTYTGYPHTDRQSPALVAELIEELKVTLTPTKVFLGGHSQGAFLSWFFATHRPDLVDGIFPVAGGLVMQCEPDVFSDAALKDAQRRVAIAIVHGRRDPNVGFSQGFAAFESFSESEFPMLRLFANDAGHGFSSLRWIEALEWLAAVTADDPAELVTWAEARLAADDVRDAIAALGRLGLRRLDSKVHARAKALSDRIDALVQEPLERFLPALRADTVDRATIDAFLEFRDRYEFATPAAPAMAAFRALRDQQEPRARDLTAKARAAFNEGRRDDGWKAYEDLVKTCPASRSYRRVKRWIAER